MSYRHWLIQTITVSYFWIVSGLEAISFLIFPSPMFLLEALWNPPKIGFLTTNWFWTHNWDTFLLHINYFLLMILICHSHHWRAVFRSHFFLMPNHATVTFFKKNFNLQGHFQFLSIKLNSNCTCLCAARSMQVLLWSKSHGIHSHWPGKWIGLQTQVHNTTSPSWSSSNSLVVCNNQHTLLLTIWSDKLVCNLCVSWSKIWQAGSFFIHLALKLYEPCNVMCCMQQ